jgi:hypothetical protein
MKATSDSAQKSRKDKGSGNTDGRMAEAYAAQNKDDCTLEEMIAVAAYFRAEQRGFASGHELSDWFEAEAEYGADSIKKSN